MRVEQGKCRAAKKKLVFDIALIKVKNQKICLKNTT